MANTHKLSFNQDGVCIAAGGMMLPGYSYQDIREQHTFDLPLSYNPLGDTLEEVQEITDRYHETGEAPSPAAKRIKMRPAEASDRFGKGEDPVQPQTEFETVEQDPDADVTDLTDRAPRRPMPEAPDKTVSEQIIRAATMLIDIRARLINLAQVAEHGTDLAESQEVREVFEDIETRAKELAVTIEAS